MKNNVCAFYTDELNCYQTQTYFAFFAFTSPLKSLLWTSWFQQARLNNLHWKPALLQRRPNSKWKEGEEKNVEIQTAFHGLFVNFFLSGPHCWGGSQFLTKPFQKLVQRYKIIQIIFNNIQIIFNSNVSLRRDVRIFPNFLQPFGIYGQNQRGPISAGAAINQYLAAPKALPANLSWTHTPQKKK